MTDVSTIGPGSAEAPRAGYAEDLSGMRRVSLYAILLLASHAYNYSFILVDYIRPFLVRDVGLTLSQTALIYSGQAAGVILGSFMTPLLVARFGSRAGLFVYSLLLAGCTGLALTATHFGVWITLRFVVGIALAGAYVSSMTMLANFFPARVRGRLLTLNMAMFSVALLTAGFVGSIVGEEGWRALIWVATVAPLIVALLTLTALPDERRHAVYGDDAAADRPARAGTWREMLTPPRLKLTLACLLLAGLNFSGYQFYSGFITTYLLEVRQFDAHVVGRFVTIDGFGTLAGSLMWGWVADRYGRRMSAIGFGFAAAFIGLFLIAPRQPSLLYALEFGYAVCLSAANCWAAYFAELFPVRLRPMGTSLFHGGHVISLGAPLVVATVASAWSLGVGMSLAPIAFLVASLLWWMLPETLKTAPLYRGFDPESASIAR
jgi:MFS family permease